MVNDPAAGLRTQSVEWTGRQGQTASRVTETRKTDTGRASTTTVTRPDGSVVHYEQTVTAVPSTRIEIIECPSEAGLP